MEDGNLSFIDELGMGEPTSENTESPEQEIVPDVTEETQDVSLDSEPQGLDVDVQEDTVPTGLDELKTQIEGLEKRVKDKDEYIDRLREESKQQEVEVTQEESVSEDDEFWEDPVEKYKELKREMHLQKLQTNEIVYASSVDKYWDTVNPDALRKAVATDTDFANTFNKSNEPYKVAYQYLSSKNVEKTASDKSLRETIRKELMAEMGVNKPKKETVPSTVNIGSSNGKKQAISDGFASVFNTK